MLGGRGGAKRLCRRAAPLRPVRMARTLTVGVVAGSREASSKFAPFGFVKDARAAGKEKRAALRRGKALIKEQRKGQNRRPKPPGSDAHRRKEKPHDEGLSADSLSSSSAPVVVGPQPSHLVPTADDDWVVCDRIAQASTLKAALSVLEADGVPCAASAAVAALRRVTALAAQDLSTDQQLSLGVRDATLAALIDRVVQASLEQLKVEEAVPEEEQRPESPDTNQDARLRLTELAGAMSAVAAFGGHAGLVREMEVLSALAARRVRESELSPRADCPALVEALCALAATSHDDEPFIALASRLLAETGFAGCDAAGASAGLWALAVLPSPSARPAPPAEPLPAQALLRWAERAERVAGTPAFGSLAAKPLARAAWALAATEGGASSRAFALVWAELARRGLAGLRGQAVPLRQVHQAALTLEDAELSELAELLPPELARAAEREWRDQPPTRESTYQKELCGILARMGLAHQAEASVRGYRVDVALPQLAVIIEADGPSHFARNTHRPLGATRLKSNHLTAAGKWRLVRIPHWTWDELDAEGARKLLETQLRASSKQ